MNRLFTTTAVLALLLAASGPAFPQTAQPSASASATRSDERVEKISPDQMRASKLIGSAVYDAKGDDKIGEINELVIDRDGKVAHVVVGVGGFLGVGEKNVALPMNEVKRGEKDRFVVSHTKDQLKEMARYDLDADRDRARTGERATTTAPAAGTSTAPATTAGSGSSAMSEADARKLLQQQGYSDITLKEDTASAQKGDWTGTAKKADKQVNVHVDAAGKVTEK
jgi:sporulation protein YlmC with PRC-barrel domain